MNKIFRTTVIYEVNLITARLRPYFEVFGRYTPLLSHLVQRDIKLKYRRSALGILWSLLSPLLMMVVMSLVFSFFFRFDIPNFPVYVLTGQLIFNNFNESTTGSMSSIIGASHLIRRVYIPKYIFPLQKIVFSFVNLMFSFIALVIVMIVTGQPFTFATLLFPVPMVLLFFFELGCGLILASLAVFFRDVMHFYTVFITALTYLTPLFYPVEILPGSIQTLIKFNPLYWYVTMFRQPILYSEVPTITQFILCSLFALVALIVGLVLFKKTQDRFILYV